MPAFFCLAVSFSLSIMLNYIIPANCQNYDKNHTKLLYRSDTGRTLFSTLQLILNELYYTINKSLNT